VEKKLVIVAGDCGVYAGFAEGGADAVSAEGKILLRCARHLRQYYAAGKTGDGSASDLAVFGLDAESPSVSQVVPGETVLLGVRRVFEVVPDAAESFGCGCSDDN